MIAALNAQYAAAGGTRPSALYGFVARPGHKRRWSCPSFKLRHDPRVRVS
jgi:hypothetical protein